MDELIFEAMETGSQYITKLKTLILPLKEFLASFSQLHALLFAFRFSASVCNTPYLRKKLLTHDVASFTNEEDNLKEIVESDKKQVDDALTILGKERKNGFPYLFEQASINMYTYLEAAIKSLVISYFKISDKIQDIKTISSIKIPLVEFKKLNEEEQLEFLYEQYEKQIGAGLKYGINRFESLLEPIGFSGRTSKTIDDGIYELAQVRNCLLHRNGYVDKKFLEACPWFTLQIGQRLIITQEQFDKYNDAISEYISILIVRVGKKDFDNI